MPAPGLVRLLRHPTHLRTRLGCGQGIADLRLGTDVRHLERDLRPPDRLRRRGLLDDRGAPGRRLRATSVWIPRVGGAGVPGRAASLRHPAPRASRVVTMPSAVWRWAGAARGVTPAIKGQVGATPGAEPTTRR